MQAEEDIFDALVEAKQRALTDPSWFFVNILNCVGPNALDAWQLECVEAIVDIFRKAAGQPTKYNHEAVQRITIRSSASSSVSSD